MITFTVKNEYKVNGTALLRTRWWKGLPEKQAEGMESSQSRRLDAIIRLLLEEQVKSGKLQRGDHVLILDSVGLSSSEIGRILGQQSKDISSWLKRLKQKPKGKVRS